MSLKFDIESIPEDEGLELLQTEKKSALKIDLPDCTLTQDIELSGRLTRLGRDVFFKGRVACEIQFACSRCLENFKTPVKTSLDVCFMPIPENEPQEEHELRESDIEVEYYKENTIDLAQPVFDQILLTQPLIPLCCSDCKGLCSQCGVNRNKNECQCGELSGAGDPRFDVLQKLKDKIK